MSNINIKFEILTIRTTSDFRMEKHAKDNNKKQQKHIFFI
jgi:hypothetical protein